MHFIQLFLGSKMTFFCLLELEKTSGQMMAPAVFVLQMNFEQT